jgi:hypothetical protein
MEILFVIQENCSASFHSYYHYLFCWLFNDLDAVVCVSLFDQWRLYGTLSLKCSKAEKSFTHHRFKFACLSLSIQWTDLYELSDYNKLGNTQRMFLVGETGQNKDFDG